MGDTRPPERACWSPGVPVTVRRGDDTHHDAVVVEDWGGWLVMVKLADNIIRHFDYRRVQPRKGA